MADPSLTSASLSSQYRRGTVIGLTLAEVFVLLSFILVLLLSLWRVQEKQRVEELIGIFSEFNDHEIKVVSRLVNTGLLDPLLESKELTEVLKVVSTLPDTEQTAFVELVRGGGYSEIAEWAQNISAAINRGVSVEAVNEVLERLSEDNSEMVKELLALDSTIDLESLISASVRSDDIESLIQRSNNSAQKFSKALESRLGDVVRSVGGSLDAATGDVTLPETALFEQGSATLTSTTKKVLNAFCRPWLLTAKAAVDIDQLKIEGHASSEWNQGDSDHYAFVQNMHLSQVRASRVLEYCLGNADDETLARWARARMIATGYSSAKVIRNDKGDELPSQSRRVVFRARMDDSQLLSNIESTVQN